MYPDLYRGLGLKKGDLSKYDTPLMGFDGHMVTLEGQISLPVIKKGREIMVTFIVVASFSPYMAIFRRPWIHDMGAVEGTNVAEDLVSVKILPRGERSYQIGAGLSDGERVQLQLFLIQNVDVFEWNPYKVPSVDPEFIVHKLNVDPLCPPKKQGRRRFAKEHVEAVRQEVGKLREAGAIRETFFLEWLANTVVLKKKSVNPDQIEAMKRLKSPNNPKEVQKLTGMLATLNRFISKFVDRCQPFYQLLKKWKGFQWNEECDRAFQDLKDYLGLALTLSAPEPGEDLYMYLSVSEHAGHTVHVLTEYPLQSLLRRFDFTGRIAKWGTRLDSFDIRYKLRNSMKGQVLADFIAEFSSRSTDITCLVEVKPWKVFVDDVSNAAGARAGIVVITPKDLKLEHSFKLGFRASNNKAEYEALLAGLRVVMDLGAKEVEVYLDCLLVVSQVQGNFEAKDPRMIEYLRLVKQMMSNFVTVKIEHIAQGQNRHADSLVTLASLIADEVPQLIRVELVSEPSITTRALILQVIEVEKCWMDPIIDFLAEDRAPEDEKEPARIQRTFARYWLSVD
ncbi:uncharacterized protein LOC142624325 [Castanea sativa]|uniref:uncharacterized protein LOC142624325 n=1 Tax=Castanea sativa TaxID=21020 RepID=UPI003F64D4C4